MQQSTSTFPSCPPYIKVQGEIDAAISHFQESARALKSYRNTLSPVSKLPVEIFSAILMLILMNVDHDCPDSRRMLSVAHVCQHWRQVTINDPLLWTQFRLNRWSKISPDLVSWSEDAPICVMFLYDAQQSLSPEVSTFISTNTRRIQKLVIRTSNCPTKVIDCLDGPAPLLQDLVLEYEDRIGQSLPSLSKLFNGAAPNLRKLRLGDVKIDWSWPGVSRITELEGCSSPHQSTLSPFTLKSMPYIKVLTVRSPLPKCPSSYVWHTPSSRIVNLGSLRKISLHRSSFRSCAFLLSHLRFPTATRIELDILPDTDDFVGTFPPFCPPDQQLRVVWGRFRKISFITPLVTLRIPLTGNDDMGKSVKVALQALATSSGLKSLTLETNNTDRLDVPDWSEICQQIDHVTHLKLNSTDSGCLLLHTLAADRFPLKLSDLNRPDAVFLPKLCHLTVKVVGHKVRVNDVSCILRGLVSARAALRARIPKVHMVDASGVEIMTF